MSKGLKMALEQLCRSIPAPDTADWTDGQLLARFAAARDEAAFAALVRRHGGMVLGVCRRMLGHVQDAEDAFQAVFLVLARKASSLTNGEAVGNWLHGVARRTSLEAKTRNARRRAREKPLDDVPSSAVAPVEPNDWLPLLDRAINRLPERYRTPFILCQMEGRSRQEVARQLGLPEGTLSSRLATARQMLAHRLARHQLTLSAGVLLAALSEPVATASVSVPLLVSTVQDALRIAAGQTVTTRSAVLMKEVLQMMLLTKLKLGATLLAAVGVLGVLTASFLAPMRAADEKAAAEPERPAEPAAKKNLATKITLRENEFGDVASLLNIKKQMCEVELQPLEPSTTLGVDIEVYKDGQKRKTYLGGNVSAPNVIRAKVALLAADLDYLPLAGAPAKHCRMKVNFALYSSNGGDGGTGTETDIPKELFDFSRVNSQSGFNAKVGGSASETPLFYFVVNRANEFFGANTMPELLEKYPKADLLIVYLRVRK